MRPNILLFLTDDHGAWAMQGIGSGELLTPNFTRLMREGVRFANAFTPCPVCSPARACLATGQTPSQTGIHDYLRFPNSHAADGSWIPADVPTLPELLAAAGYHTLHSGKRHLGNDTRTPAGVDRYFGLAKGTGGHNGTLNFVCEGKPLTVEGNKTACITDHALRFLDERPRGQPFFLNIGYTATHSPYVSHVHDSRWTALYQNAHFHELGAFTPHPWSKNEGIPRDRIPNDADVRDTRIGYHAAVSEIDHNLGRVLEYLSQAGDLDKTLVIYTSDHGCAVGQQGFWGKGNSTRPLNMCEISLRIPLLLRWPEKVPAATVNSRCVDHYDTFLSILDWAAVAPPSTFRYPGRSYRPLAEGTALADWRDARFGEYGDLRMLRTPDAKWIRRYPDGPHDLYDLREDPTERLNLAGWDAWWPRQQAMDEALTAWYAHHEVPGRSGLRVKCLPQHNPCEAWRDGLRERRGLQVYPPGAPTSMAT